MELGISHFATAGSLPKNRPSWRLRADAVAMATQAIRVWDFLSVAGAGYVTAIVYERLSGEDGPAAHFGSHVGSLSLLGGLLATFAFRSPAEDNLDPFDRHRSLIGTVRASAPRAALLLGLLFAVMVLTRMDFDAPRLWMIMWAASIVLVTVGGRLVMSVWLRAMEARGILRQRIAVLGSGPGAKQLVARLRSQTGPAVELAGVYDVEAPGTDFEATCASLIRAGQRHALDRVIIVMSEPAAERLHRMIAILKTLDVPVALCSDVMEVANSAIDIRYFGAIPMLQLVNRPIGAWGLLAKNSIDKLASAVLLLLLAPLLLLVAVLVKCESPGPVLFRQRREGRNNTAFEVLKFRTMRVPGPEDSVARFEQTNRNDKRITRVGAVLRSWSIDELPQLINVLRGDMSLVGPRPHACEMRTCNMLNSEIVAEYTHRHRVKPGLTGWAQVKGYRGATETPQHLRQRVEHDLYYIENWSLLFDLWIILITPTMVLFSRQNAF